MDADTSVLGSDRKNARKNLDVIAGVILVSMAVIGGSSSGPLSNFIPPESSYLRQAWRCALAA